MLPKVETPLFHGTLPSTGEEIKFRPFLVKEEKILMLASQSDEFKDLVNACTQVVENCTFGKVDINKLPMYDLQDLFLQIRRNSIGSEQEFVLTCGECDKTTPYTIDLNELKVEGLQDMPDGKISVNDEFIIKMRYPTAISFVNDFDTDDDISVISSCIEAIETEEESTAIEDVSREELVEFLESLPIDVMNEMRTFIRAMPTLVHIIDYTCPHCNSEQKVSINGYEHFFA